MKRVSLFSIFASIFVSSAAYASGYYNLSMFWKTQTSGSVCSMASPNIGWSGFSADSYSGGFDFGPVTIGTPSTMFFEVDNATSPTVSLSAGTPALSGDFAWQGGAYPGTSGNCGSTLASPGRCSVQVTYNPSGRGADAGTVSVEYGGSSPATKAISGYGTYAIVPTFVTKTNGSANATCAILSNGTAKCWGVNTNGMLGTGNTTVIGDNTTEMNQTLAPINLGTGRTAKQISIGVNHTCAITDEDKVKCWGAGTSGRTGYGDTIARDQSTEFGNSLPYVNLGTSRTAKKIGAGDGFTCALLDNNKMKCWGLATNGSIGAGDTNARGDVSTEMGDSLAYIDIGTDRLIKDFDIGATSTCVITDENKVKCFGYGNGYLGYGDNILRGDGPNEMGPFLPYVDLGTNRTAKKISVGLDNTCVILDNNDLKCWGSNTSGSLGLGDALSRGDSTNQMGDFLPAVNLGTGRTAKEVSVGKENTCAILDNGTVKCWGNEWESLLPVTNDGARGNGSGEMGDDLPVTNMGTGRTALQVAIGNGAGSACALLDNYAIKCWGDSTSGQTGYGDTSARGGSATPFGDNLRYVVLNEFTEVESAFGGLRYKCMKMKRTNEIKCFGDNANGKLGYGDTTTRGGTLGTLGENLGFVDLGTGTDNNTFAPTNIVTVAHQFACASNTLGDLKCWGGNNLGQLGLGDVASRGDAAGEMGTSLPRVNVGTSRTVKGDKSVNHGANHMCVLLDNDTVKCWGENTGGRLGVGDTATRGDGAGEMGDNLPSVTFAAGVTPAKVYTTGYNSLILSTAGNVYGWGSNSQGTIGYGDTGSRGQNGTTMGNNLPAINLGTNRTVKEVIPGQDYSVCFILDNDTLKCIGTSANGLLGYGDTITRGDASTEMGDNLPAVDLGTNRTVVSAEVGYYHACAILDNGDLKCWGQNSNGELGYGDTAPRDQTTEMGDNLPAIALGTGRTAIKVFTEQQRTCAILDNYQMKCWGSPSVAPLGYSDSTVRGDNANELGDYLPYISLGTYR